MYKVDKEDKADTLEYMGNIGENIKMIRRAKGMTQESLADVLGYTKSFLSHVESGNRVLSTDDLAKVAAALGVSVSDLHLQPKVTVHFRSAAEVLPFEEQKMGEDFLSFARKFRNQSDE